MASTSTTGVTGEGVKDKSGARETGGKTGVDEKSITNHPRLIKGENKESIENASASEPQPFTNGFTEIIPEDKLLDVFIDGDSSTNEKKNSLFLPSSSMSSTTSLHLRSFCLLSRSAVLSALKIGFTSPKYRAMLEPALMYTISMSHTLGSEGR
ncbi:hypothetical protein E2C01_017323 [Portunus trituberculatus]|uniref:Uncharacterized protein n=1 Tax=Portunus trituberculatus TaxID=210409 RepID=A0A5B7DT27_PORTR|nr:hypothetical protein [Portunus trituberculatus]